MLKLALFVFLSTAVLAQDPTFPKPTCYDESVGGKASNCLDFVAGWCTANHEIRHPPGAWGGRCLNDNSGGRCEFISYNDETKDDVSVEAYCEDVLKNIAGNCTAGGYGTSGPNAYLFALKPFPEGDCKSSFVKDS